MLEWMKRKGVLWSARTYFVDALSYMALGLFSSLLIGLIMKTLGTQLGIELFVELGTFAMDGKVVGAAIGVAVAYALKAPPLLLFSAIFVGAMGNQVGGVAGSYFAVLVTVEFVKLLYQTTKLDILVVPFSMILMGYGSAQLIGLPIQELMSYLGNTINWATMQHPLIMSMIVATIMGLALTAPISSAALSFMLGLEGVAAGAAVIGCSAQMVGFAAISYRENGFSGAVAQGIGTSMLQIGNIVKNPWILLPPTLAGLICAPIAIVGFEMLNNKAGAGMGTSGFVGQFMAFETMGFSVHTASLVLVFHIILPVVLSLGIAMLMRQKGLINTGDLTLTLR
ncbi:PTS sugar transporter subunit IIC [Wohlfahrtiimonas chitiniclastica]|uniref:PTS transporter subunit IIC n=1 Tax=Wohlfahrtiimonas chitiniclastica TaxID=400946 RepID=UPI000B99D4BF|nr:PTS sugar transporter subunit IIC [Wohlfahrtiimonas chitiniclastica]OYQ78218.1 PTS sugar transporter subunit IIC [Wohlfahrtiimonas chitiniclastica]